MERGGLKMAPATAGRWLCILTSPPKDALEGNRPPRRPQKRLGRRLEEVAKSGWGRLLSVTNATGSWHLPSGRQWLGIQVHHGYACQSTNSCQTTACPSKALITPLGRQSSCHTFQGEGAGR